TVRAEQRLRAGPRPGPRVLRLDRHPRRTGPEAPAAGDLQRGPQAGLSAQGGQGLLEAGLRAAPGADGQPVAGDGAVLRPAPPGPRRRQVAVHLRGSDNRECGMSVAPSPSPGSPAAAAASDSRPAHELAQQAQQMYQKVAAEVARVVVGAELTTQQLLIALLAGGHVLLEGVPGVAKTTLSKVFARLLGCQYQRVQFTPDLLPSDVTGTSIFDRNANEFVL